MRSLFALLLPWWEGVRMALEAIAAHRLRSLLTTLGIIIGIVSVTAMFTTIDGINRGFERTMAMLGTNVLYVEKWPWGFGSEEYRWWEYINRRPIDPAYAEEILALSEYADAVDVGVATRRMIRYRDRSAEVSVQGRSPYMMLVSNAEVAEGRFFTETEDRAARFVVVLGAEAAEALFPDESPLGKRLYIGSYRFEVIGVLARQGRAFGVFRTDNMVIIPFGTFRRVFGTRERNVTIAVKYPNAAILPEAREELRGILRRLRALRPEQEDDFSINEQEAIRQQYEQVTGVIYAIGIGLTALSLLVGGIGVMNIMFVSVRERTREIGIRKAVGAPARAILWQFLVESVVICTLGGVVGIALSALVTWAINRVFTAYLSPVTVVLAFGICLLTGIVFGYLPARQAARANPVEALRYE
jgi:putative ABC transport system permease protein|nr:MAG: ABC transporter ATP-binding protein [Bacteroidota bacterium]